MPLDIVGEDEELILVFSLVFAFLLIHLKIFPHAGRLRIVLAVTVFSIVISFLVSFISVYGFYPFHDTDDIATTARRYNPVLAQFSLPFYLKAHNDGSSFWPARNLWEGIYFAGAQLWGMKFGVSVKEGRLAIYPPEQPDVNYTIPLFYQLVLILTAFNMIGMPLAAFIAYKLKTTLPNFIQRHPFHANPPSRHVHG